MINMFGPKQGDDNFGSPLPKDQGALEAKIQKYRAMARCPGNLRGLDLAISQEHLGDLLYELGMLTKEEDHFMESQQAYAAALSALLICEPHSLNS
jgi:hypothetical protein